MLVTCATRPQTGAGKVVGGGPLSGVDAASVPWKMSFQVNRPPIVGPGPPTEVARNGKSDATKPFESTKAPIPPATVETGRNFNPAKSGTFESALSSHVELVHSLSAVQTAPEFEPRVHFFVPTPWSTAAIASVVFGSYAPWIAFGSDTASTRGLSAPGTRAYAVVVSVHFGGTCPAHVVASFAIVHAVVPSTQRPALLGSFTAPYKPPSKLAMMRSSVSLESGAPAVVPPEPSRSTSPRSFAYPGCGAPTPERLKSVEA